MQRIRATCRLQNDQSEPCSILLDSDLDTLILELKSACLANGQTPEACQAVEDAPSVTKPDVKVE